MLKWEDIISVIWVRVMWNRKKKNFVLSNFMHASSNLNVLRSLRHVSILVVDLLPDAAIEPLVPLPGLLIHTVMEALQHFKLSIMCLYLAQHTQTYTLYINIQYNNNQISKITFSLLLLKTWLPRDPEINILGSLSFLNYKHRLNPTKCQLV